MHLAFIDFAHPMREIDPDPVGQSDFRDGAAARIRAMLPSDWQVTTHTLRDLAEAKKADGYYFGGCMTSVHLYEKTILEQVAELVDDPKKPTLLACGSMQAYCFHKGSTIAMLGLTDGQAPDIWQGYAPGAIKINRPEVIRAVQPDPFWDACELTELVIAEYHCHQVIGVPPGWLHVGRSGSCAVEIIRRGWDHAPKLALQGHPENGSEGAIAVRAFLKMWEIWIKAEANQSQMVEIFTKAFTQEPRQEKWNTEAAQEYLNTIRAHGEVIRLWQRDLDLVTLQTSDPGDKLIGFAASHLKRSEYRMEIVAIDPEVQGQKIGKYLTLSLYNRGRELGYSPDMITIETRQDTPAMIHIVEGLAFKKESTHKATYGGETSERFLWRGDAFKCPPVYWTKEKPSALN